MYRVRGLLLLLLCCLALGWAVTQLTRTTQLANCAECGDGPKDKKCANGYKCVDSKCVKK